MAMVTGNFSELLYPGLKAIFGEKSKDHPEEYSKFFEVLNSTQSYEDTLEMSGLGLIQPKTQGASVTFDDMIQGGKHRVTHITYGLATEISRELIEDDQYSKINRVPAYLARSTRVTIETIAANVINRATNGSYLGVDSTVLASASHPLLGGGTQSNLGTNADLSLTSLEEAFNAIGAWTDNRGLKVAIMPKMLVVPVATDWTASILTESSNRPVYTPTVTADSGSTFSPNSNNPYKGRIPYMVSHFITDPDSWFILTDCPDGLKFYWRRKPAFEQDNVFTTQAANYMTSFRCSATWDDYRAIFYNAGV